MLARTSQGEASVYDFFCQTPLKRKARTDNSFFPILADFGTDTQEFHVGLGAMAVPGVVAGLFRVHRDLGRMPIAEIMQPAIELARAGVELNALHHYIIRILEAILRADPAAFAIYQSPAHPDELVSEGETLCHPDMANAFDALSVEGEQLFYQGDWAKQLARDSLERGGHVTMDDLAAYRVERRQPLEFKFDTLHCLINPPPSPGGCLIAFALKLLEQTLSKRPEWGGPDYLTALLDAMRSATMARREFEQGNERSKASAAGWDSSMMSLLLADSTISSWLQQIQNHSLFSRGTTQISVADADGNIASLTASNGEGNVYVLPGTGVMLNNMLGEEDLNPGGFHCWQEGSRLASMMSPMVAERADGTRVALGTGGSNRIRSAILQTVVNIEAYGLSLEQAVAASRLHLEGDRLSIEPGFSEAALARAAERVPDVHQWPAQNLFFGGVHAVQVSPDGGFEGAGDPRRNGFVAVVN